MFYKLLIHFHLVFYKVVSVFSEQTFAIRHKGRDPPSSAPFDVNIAHAQIALKMMENLANAGKRATESRRRPLDRKSSKTNEEMKEFVFVNCICCSLVFFSFLSFL